MRGTQRKFRYHQLPNGIIPAYAGNTSSMRYRPVAYWDHPRICGEHYRLPTHVEALRGSSPHMRGTPIPYYPHSGGYGIIPAYAGNTIDLYMVGTGAWDHPRICGEHNFVGLPMRRWRGSSPHMRGTLRASFLNCSMTGIIPAYAGNTLSMKSGIGLYGDHPRICGEHRWRVLRSGRSLGSSPHMRGTLHPPSGRQQPAGIIPAYAGNTFPGSRLRWSRGDHPRICGEHRAYDQCRR